MNRPTVFFLIRIPLLVLILARAAAAAPRAGGNIPDALVPPAGQAGPVTTAWKIEEVDVPKYFDSISTRCLAVDAGGNLHLAYGDNRLYYAAGIGMNWRKEIADPAIGTGKRAAISIGRDGCPRIAYRDEASQDLKYAVKPGDRWYTFIASAAGDVGENFALALDPNDLAQMICRNTTDDSLIYIRDTGESWFEEVIDTGGNAGKGAMNPVALVVGSNSRPHAAYIKDGWLYYAWRDGTGWHQNQISQCLGSVDIALDDTGLPGLVYVEANTGRLIYAYPLGPNWVKETVDGSQCSRCSLVRDANGQPRVCYNVFMSAQEYDLRFAIRNHDGTWSHKLVMENATAGGLVLGPGDVPYIAFLQGSQLRYIKYECQPGPECHWLYWTVDHSEEERGEYHSLALDSAGQPLVGYCDGSNLNVACQINEEWNSSVLDNTSSGNAVSLVVTAGDAILLAFQNALGLQLLIKHGLVSFIETVDADPHSGISPSLALDPAGNLHLSYVKFGQEDQLMYACKRNGAWQISNVARAPVISHTALAVDPAGHPRVVFTASREVKYTAHNGTTWENPVTVDSQYKGGRCSITLDASGQPHLAYQANSTPGDWNNDELRYAHRENSAWYIETIERGPGTGMDPSIAPGKNGRPVISYACGISSQTRLKLASLVCLDMIVHTCFWLVESVDSLGDTGHFPSMKISPAGDIHISYYSASARGLMYAYYDMPAEVKNFTIGGMFGAGIEKPERALHLRGSNAVFRLDRNQDAAAFLMVRTGTAGNPQKGFMVGTEASGANQGRFIFRDTGTSVADGAGANRLTIENDGRVNVSKTLKARSFTTASTFRLKENIHPLQLNPVQLNLLQGFRFRWRDTGQPDVGFIAEAMTAALPEAVEGSVADGTTGVNYTKVLPVLIEGVKLQERRLQDARRRAAAVQALLLQAEAAAVRRK